MTLIPRQAKHYHIDGKMTGSFPFRAVSQKYHHMHIYGWSVTYYYIDAQLFTFKEIMNLYFILFRQFQEL